MPEYPIRVPKSEQEHQVAKLVESYINHRFDSVSAPRMTFSYSAIAQDLGVPVDTVREMLAPLGGTGGVMVWRNTRRRRT